MRTSLQEVHARLSRARADPRRSLRVGHTTRLALDPSRLYLFSPGTGESLTRDGAAVAAAR